MTLLADVADFESLLGVPFTAAQHKRAELVLKLASGEVEAYCNAVALTRRTSTIELRGTWETSTILPGLPVHEVEAVEINGEPITEFTFNRRGLITTRDRRWAAGPSSTIKITYDHGFDQVPEVIRSVVLSRAARGFSNPEGIMQARMGADYSISYSADAEAVTSLNRSEREMLKRYRTVVA